MLCCITVVMIFAEAEYAFGHKKTRPRYSRDGARRAIFMGAQEEKPEISVSALYKPAFFVYNGYAFVVLNYSKFFQFCKWRI